MDRAQRPTQRLRPLEVRAVRSVRRGLSGAARWARAVRDDHAPAVRRPCSDLREQALASRRDRQAPAAPRARGVARRRRTARAAHGVLPPAAARAGTGELGGDGNARRGQRRDRGVDRDGELSAKVLDRTPMKLARAGFADAHTLPGLPERQRLSVVALQDLALTRRQAGHRGAHTHAEILRLVALREFVLLSSSVVTVLDKLIERHGPLVGALLPLRRGLALAPTVRPSEFVHAADLVEVPPLTALRCANCARGGPGG